MVQWYECCYAHREIKGLMRGVLGVLYERPQRLKAVVATGHLDRGHRDHAAKFPALT
jgi:hypothetical protein